MCRNNFNYTRRGAQTTLEYAVVITCIIAALLSMQIYMKRAISGRFRQISDDIGPQYEPRKTTGDTTQAIARNVTGVVTASPYEATVNGTIVIKTIYEKNETINNETTQEWGYEEVGPMD